MKRIFCYIVLFILFVVQSTLNKYIDIMHIFPNLILVYVICCSLKNEPVWSAVLGGCAGLLMDLSLSRNIGMNTIMLMYTAIVLSYFGFSYLKDNIFISALCALLISFIYEGLYGFLSLVIFGHSNIGQVAVISLLEAIYNGFISFLIYPLAGWLSREQIRSF